MPATPNVGPPRSADESLPATNCEALLRRACFGHLAFARDGHADVLPIRYIFLDGWVYFRADLGLSEVIAHSPWLVLSVTEFQDANLVSSVIVRGGCYQTEQTGTTIGDAAALRGINELRDRAMVGPQRKPRGRRSSTVFRLHVDEMRGITALVPGPARDRSFDDRENQHVRQTGRDQSAPEDARATADSVAEAVPPRRATKLPCNRLHTVPAPRTPVEIAEATTLRSAIGETLAATPLDEAILRRDVWSYVGAEQHSGTSAGHVIMVLVDVIEQAAIAPLVERQALTRRVILWCVEAYFGHLGGDVVGRDGMALSDSAAETETA